MKHTPWDIFFCQSAEAILKPGKRVLDVGAGLRVDAKRGNVVDASRAWIKDLLPPVEYVVMDPVETYHPDVVGDVTAMPFPDQSFDHIICLSVLEHVAKPWLAFEEIWRILKPGGSLFLYVPFLSAYHAMPGYYGDYHRWTEDGLRSAFERFENLHLCPVRGPAETVVHFFPNGWIVLHSRLRVLARWIDMLRHSSGKQVSGYFCLANKP